MGRLPPVTVPLLPPALSLPPLPLSELKLQPDKSSKPKAPRRIGWAGCIAQRYAGRRHEGVNCVTQ
jgi:hypothetical protein